MNVSLPDELIEFVHEETKRGGYGNHSELVRDSLRQFRERRQKRQTLLRALEAGHQDTVNGRTTPLTEARLQAIAERARARRQKPEVDA